MLNKIIKNVMYFFMLIGMIVALGVIALVPVTCLSGCSAASLKHELIQTGPTSYHQDAGSESSKTIQIQKAGATEARSKPARQYQITKVGDRYIISIQE